MAHTTATLSPPPRLTNAPAEAARTSGELCIGWIDVSQLTRECLTSSVARLQPLFVIIPFESVRDCAKHTGRAIDLIVYHSHENDADTDWLEDIAALREAFTSVQIVVLSDVSAIEPAIVREVLNRGASGFVMTDSTSLQMVVSAISLVGSGGTFVPRDFLFMDREPAPSTVSRPLSEVGRLTQREIAVLALMKHGKPNKIIAHELGMSASTVKVHVRHIMRKMGAANRTQAALNADRLLGIAGDTGDRLRGQGA
ncbi:LuxR C-terminal-related transcriptional regulator [Acidisoma sp.]|uniref:LuxR C-terminal-related transcriptional regulator n=1 Tax=Acidisoma sp. TaxID=1872115 RepID=UPI003B001837